MRHVGKEDRNVVGAILFDRAPGIRADEQRPVPEVAGHLGREMWPGALDMEMRHPDIGEIGGLGVRDQGVEQCRRGRRRAMDVDLIAAIDGRDSLFWGHDAHRKDSTTQM